MYIRIVAYDCDGVLFDSLQANTAYYNEILARFGKPPMDETAAARTHYETVIRSIEYLFRDDPRLDDALREAKNLDYTPFTRLMSMEPHLKETLKGLKSCAGTAVVTNRTNTIKPLLAQTGLDSYFDLVVSALDVSKPKPHPESLNRVVQHFNADPRQVLFIGDSISDQQAAANAGVFFASYKNQNLEADFQITDHRQVQSIIGNNIG